MRVALLISSLLVAAAQPVAAQANPMSTALGRQFAAITTNILKAAEQFPAAKYSWKPTPDVRSFGELIGHVTDAHFLFCSRMKGETSPQTAQTPITTRADLVTKLTESIAYCTAAYGAATDAAVAEMIQIGTNRVVRLNPMVTNIGHDNEHYGNIVTYMRLNGLVPPSSQTGN